MNNFEKIKKQVREMTVDEMANLLIDRFGRDCDHINQITLSDGAPTLYSGLCFKEDELLSDIDFVESDVGKTVFLTREEAEKGR